MSEDWHIIALCEDIEDGDGKVIECPLHQGRFDIRNGKVLCSPPTKPLTTYPVRIINDSIQIRVD